MKKTARNEKNSPDGQFYPRLEVPKRRILEFQETVFIGKKLEFLIENHQIFRLEMTRLIKYSEYWLPPFSYFCGSMKYE